MSSFSQWICLLFLIALQINCNNKEVSSKNNNQPNVIFFLVDDMGWKDLGCYGSTFYETPNIDRLAKNGIRFTNAYAACPVCSPTRASILTGKYPARLNITDWIPGLDPKDRPLLGTKDQHELPLSEKTIAEVVKEKGYATGFFGKWHLGEKGFYPENQGFDLNIGGHWAGQPASYFYPYKNERKRWDVPHLEQGQKGEYLTDRLTEEAIQFVEKQKEQPFFLYLAYYSVHTPIQAKPALEKKYTEKKTKHYGDKPTSFQTERDNRSRIEQDHPAYAGMVQSVDESIGNIMNRLSTLGLLENTIIIFTSDNGGLSTLPQKRSAPTSVLPLRAGKGWLYEGGIRVPTIISWKGNTQIGTVENTPIISTDFFPTLLDILVDKSAITSTKDGKSLVPLLEGQPLSKRALYWHFPHYHGSGNVPSAAIRVDNYKLIEWMETGQLELYDLENDIGERRNLAEIMPDKAALLLSKLHDWQATIGALSPLPNPDYSSLK